MNDLFQRAINNPTLKSVGSGVYDMLTGGENGRNASQTWVDVTTGKRKYGDLSDTEQKQFTQHMMGSMMGTIGEVQPIQSITPENAQFIKDAAIKVSKLKPFTIPETTAIEDIGRVFGSPYNLRQGVDHVAIVNALKDRISKYIPFDIPKIIPK